MEHQYTTNTTKNETKQPQEEGILFYCRCKSLKRIYTLLSSLRSVSNSSQTGNSTSNNTSILTSSNDLLASQNVARRAISLKNTADSSRKNNKEQIAEVFVNASGLTVHVYGVARQSQASVDMGSGLFSDFYVCEEEMELGDKIEKIVGGSFSINLTTLLECLHALDSSAGTSYYTAGNMNEIELCMSYSTRDAIMKLELLERSYNPSLCLDLIGSAALAGVESSIDGKASALTVAFRSQEILARAIVKSEFLRLAVVELEVAGATCCSLCIWNKGLELGVIGSCGESFVQLPYNSADTINQGFVSLEASPQYVLCTYPLYLLLQAFRGLEIADETCLTINTSHMLAIQHQVMDPAQMNHNESPTSEPNYVDFIIASITDPSLDDEYEEAEENTMNVQNEDDDVLSVSIPQPDTQQLPDQPPQSPPIQPEQHAIHSTTNDKTSNNSIPQSPTQSPPISNRNPRKRPSQSSSKNENNEPKPKRSTTKKQPFLFTLNDDDSSSSNNNSTSTTSDAEDDYYYFTPPTSPKNTPHSNNNSEQKEITSSPELMFGDTSLANVEKNCLVREENKKKRHWNI